MLLSVSKKPETSCVGIDFGTTNSLVALYDATNDKIELVEFEDGSSMLSSEFAYDTVSIQAIKRAISCPAEAKAYGLQTKIEEELIYFYIGNRWISIIEIVAHYFRNLRIKTNQFFKRNIVNCILTVPARYDEYQKQIVVRAAAAGGWKVVRLISEPTAGFIGQEEDEDGVYGVYDLGGGTFDFSLIRKAGDVFQVLGTTGDISIGMDYMDRRIGKTLNPDLDDTSCLLSTRNLRESGELTDLT